MLGGGGGRVLAQPQQLKAGFASLTMRLGRDLDLSLQKFPPDMADGAEIGGLKQRIRRFRRRLESPRVGKEIFLLDAELKPAFEGEQARPFGRRQKRAQGESSLLRIESEFHRLPMPLQVGLFRLASSDRVGDCMGIVQAITRQRAASSTQLLLAVQRFVAVQTARREIM
jgi:hypothetical protein